ncbi:ABC-type branched-chain amino acid transport system, permease component [Sphaerochaeta pleomorpha str. Grapes]|uniref:ABC-type branched-chain amino acid transport system, permease component n=1 Tax=Sphaerochaeta pleomorpha (strain ATCC BAA-1885 / DSM 22778 / Grapes) TaxID=158190 RepID=G8QUF0_SPHPG|nr:branched-chain amino acid ABC transporter permease [Sphaerochaeta pleomorpha]AEV29183.1 ABC-type branched-chain amino acid transport system, permease component [Sphaerochaeta pleomorpha str. Grapes]
MRIKRNSLLTIISVLLLVGLLYWLNYHKAGNGMLISILQKSAILALVAVSMNLLNGFTGLFSLGQAGFMSIGAYTTAILLIPVKNLDGVYYMNGVHPAIRGLKIFIAESPVWFQEIFPYIALLIGALFAAFLAALVGMAVLRLKSDYLAIATLGLSEIVRAIFSSPQLDQVTNGSYGLNKIPAFPAMFGGLIPSMVTPFVLVTICIAFMMLLIKSSYGRAFKAIREDEIAAEAMGINIFKHEEMSFVVSSFFSALAGGLLAMYMRSIEAKTFSIPLTYDILLIVVIGGIGSVTGSILSAFLVTASKEWWLRFFDQPLNLFGWQVPLFRTGFRMIIFSILLMVVVLVYRRGLMGSNEFSWDRILAFFKRRGKKQGGAK